MACIKGYDTITGKPCVDQLQQGKKYIGAFEKGPHQFYQNMQGIGSGKRQPTIEEAVRTGDPKALMNNFDDTYRPRPAIRKMGGAVIKGKSLRNPKGSRRCL